MQAGVEIKITNLKGEFMKQRRDCVKSSTININKKFISNYCSSILNYKEVEKENNTKKTVNNIILITVTCTCLVKWAETDAFGAPERQKTQIWKQQQQKC